MKNKLKEIIKSNIYLNFLYKYFIVKKNKFLFSDNKKAEKHIIKKYLKLVGYEIDFNEKPESFTQKIQFRKLYPENKLFTKYADKYLVREYVKDKIGEEYLIPLYLVTENLTKKEWEKLPKSFVVKPNHDSQNVEIIKNKDLCDYKKIIKKMNMALKINFGWYMLERHYINIKPKIIVEKLLTDEKGNLPKDYKFYCFKNIIIVQVIERDFKNHRMKMIFLDENWQKINIKRDEEELCNIQKPQNFEKMINISKKLSENFNYVRVDLYNLDGKIYFGELTFTPFSGFAKFYPVDWDYKLGEYWKGEI